MAEYSRHDPANSNTITQQEYEDMNAPHQPNGVIGAYGDTSIVYADGSARAVKIRANKRAKVRGRTWYNDAIEMQLTIAPNASGSVRVDTVVLRLSRSTWQVRLAVVQGTPGAGAPPLTMETASGNTVWEIPLTDVTVVSGASVINTGNVKTREWYIGPDGMAISHSTTSAPVGVQLGARWYHADTGLMHMWDGAVWNRMPWNAAWGVIAQGYRTTPSSSTTSIVGIFRLDSVQVIKGRMYRITTPGLVPFSTVVGDDIEMHVRVRAGGVACTTSDPVVKGAVMRATWQSSTTSPIIPVVGTYSTAVNTAISLLLCIARSFGSGLVSNYADASMYFSGLYIEDIGPTPALSGVNV